MTQPFVSYAQHGEDVILWRALGDGATRFYVDVGAYDPTEDSVTRALYERGWRGINIEPQVERIAAFERDRPEDTNLALAIGAAPGRAALHVPATAGWATLDDGVADRFRAADQTVADVEVEVRTLSDVLAAHGVEVIDVLKIDVEGAEPDVVRGLDLTRFRPRVVVIEGVAPEIGRAAGDEAVRLLTDAGYTHCQFDGINHFLTCEEGLVDDLSVPANPLDGYVTAARVALEAVIEAQDADRRELLRAIERLDPPPPTPIAEILARYPAARIADPAVVRGRRRLALTRLLAHAPDVQNLIDWAAPVTVDAAQELTEIIALRDQELVVGGIYRVVLRREADAGGLASWLEVLRSGVAPIEVARLMAASPEVVGRGEAHETAILGVVEAAASRAALRDLRRHGLDPADARRGTGASRALTVYAVFDVCLGRSPSPTELASETARLAGGLGRDRLISAYARHPEAWRRMVGPVPEGFAGKVVRRVGHRRVMSVARPRVAAAEIRRIAEMGMIASAIPDADAERGHEPEGGDR